MSFRDRRKNEEQAASIARLEQEVEASLLVCRQSAQAWPDKSVPWSM
jgi:hypothetical protein